MRLTLALTLAATTAALLLATRDARAQGEQPQGESVAMSANRGLHVGLAPTLLFPIRDNGPYGGGLGVDGRYGLRAGPTVLSPGGLVSGYGISGRFIGIAMPTFRITVPVGPLAPYAVGGLGGGWISNPSEGGVSMLGGGGLMIHFGRFFAIGGEITYQKITGTDFGAVAFGPAISFGG